MVITNHGDWPLTKCDDHPSSPDIIKSFAPGGHGWLWACRCPCDGCHHHLDWRCVGTQVQTVAWSEASLRMGTQFAIAAKTYLSMAMVVISMLNLWLVMVNKLLNGCSWLLLLHARVCLVLVSVGASNMHHQVESGREGETENWRTDKASKVQFL